MKLIMDWGCVCVEWERKKKKEKEMVDFED